MLLLYLCYDLINNVCFHRELVAQEYVDPNLYSALRGLLGPRATSPGLAGWRNCSGYHDGKVALFVNDMRLSSSIECQAVGVDLHGVDSVQCVR